MPKDNKDLLKEYLTGIDLTYSNDVELCKIKLLSDPFNPACHNNLFIALVRQQVVQRIVNHCFAILNMSGD